MTAAVNVGDGSSALDVGPVDGREGGGLGRSRTLALIASGAPSAGGFFHAPVETLAAEPGSTTEAAEQLLRQPVEPSSIALAIVIVLMVAVAGAATAVALRRHAD